MARGYSTAHFRFFTLRITLHFETKIEVLEELWLELEASPPLLVHTG